MDGYTDVHCHVIPGVDDGAQDLNESLRMLLYMYEEGIRRVIATPHYHGGYMEPRIGKIKERFDELKSAMDYDERLSTMELYLGCELYYYPSVTEWLDEGRVATMAGSDYVLLEFGYTMDMHTINAGTGAVINAGYIPIIAHAERYTALVSDLDAVESLIKKGAYIQVNTGAFHGGFKKRSFVKKLFKNRMVHFVGTDAHDDEDRPPNMALEAEYIGKHYGEDYCRMLFVDNPAKVINNERI